MKSVAVLFVCLAAVLVMSSWIIAEPTGEPQGAVYSPYAQGGMVAIREVTLKPGADAAAFERFVAEEYLPKMSQFWPGARVMVVKGERGENVGEYLHLFVFDSKDVRDLYWPTADTYSPVFQGIVDAYGGVEAYRALNARFGEYAEVSTEYTDYVAIQ